MASPMITKKTMDLIDLEKTYSSYTARIPYFPLVVTEARGSLVRDIEGNEFIDFLSSAAVANTGHNHPRVVAAAKEQLEKFIHYTPAYMYHKPHAELIEKLAYITPGDFEKRIAFGLSGSSSVDGAIKAARIYTNRPKIVSFLRSYHGTTMGAISISGISLDIRRKMGPLVPEVEFIPYPDCYRCQFNKSYPQCNLACWQYAEELFATIIPPEEVAAVIYEPIQGDAGIVTPPLEYMTKLQQMCKNHGILLIADEVQTGFGRTGKMFASEHNGIVPDILVMGKAMASGMPLSGLAARKEIFEVWHAPAHFFNTAGNPVSCSAALATIEVINEEGLIANAVSQGTYIKERFQDLMNRFDCIGDVRGSGLLVGVDIVKDKATKERDVNKTAKICWRCWEKGLILAFFSGSVLRIAPPLVLAKTQAEKALDIIEQAILEVEKNMVPDEILDEIKGW